LDELRHALVIGHANPPLSLPMALNGVPQSAIDTNLPAAIGEDIRPKLRNACLLKKGNRPARRSLLGIAQELRVRAEVVDLNLGILKEPELSQHVRLLGGVVKGKLQARVPDDHTVRTGGLAPQNLHVPNRALF